MPGGTLPPRAPECYPDDPGQGASGRFNELRRFEADPAAAHAALKRRVVALEAMVEILLNAVVSSRHQPKFTLAQWWEVLQKSDPNVLAMWPSKDQA